jgi:uncharacterized membrane protein
MNWLIIGIGLFTIVHLASSLAPSLRASLKQSIGEKPFRGVYALLSLAGIAMIVVGWRSTVPVVVYAPPSWAPTVAFFLMFVAIVLFGASHAKTNIKRYVRHPQLTSVVLFAIAHLLANGDIRSLILFGSLGVWALLEMPLINKREGEWIKPPRASMKSEMIGAAISVVVFLVLIALHPYFAGVSPLPA